MEIISENGLIVFGQINQELFASLDPCVCPFRVRACVKVWVSNADFQGRSSSFAYFSKSFMKDENRKKDEL